jgi:putative flippase GtrA
MGMPGLGEEGQMARRRVLARLLRFQLVAWGGTLVNLGVLWLLHGRLGVPLVAAGAAAIETAIIHNFTWHYLFTWRDRVDGSAADYICRLLRYNLVTASIDFTVNLGVLWGLVRFAGVHYLLADLAGMVAGPVVKFLANEFLVFRKAQDGQRAATGDAGGGDADRPVREARPSEDG